MTALQLIPQGAELSCVMVSVFALESLDLTSEKNSEGSWALRFVVSKNPRNKTKPLFIVYLSSEKLDLLSY